MLQKIWASIKAALQSDTAHQLYHAALAGGVTYVTTAMTTHVNPTIPGVIGAVVGAGVAWGQTSSNVGVQDVSKVVSDALNAANKPAQSQGGQK